jgi:hypothetical protein
VKSLLLLLLLLRVQAMWKKKETFRGATRIDATAETKPVKKAKNKLQQNATKSRRNLERAKREISERSTSVSPKVEATATETSPSGPAETSRPPRKPQPAKTTKGNSDATQLTSIESDAQAACASSPTDERLPAPSTRTFAFQTTMTPNARKPVRSA